MSTKQDIFLTRFQKKISINDHHTWNLKIEIYVIVGILRICEVSEGKGEIE